ncbi:hypothetical protein D9611_011338 [Ephemerocybe angulata]|uniref:Nephrocystin 3-like N-terminal domain-containing protein n=1 Tax=Ephemerocybe angulata TaxID=980116 RepID=A0A8H5BBR8_9AGAR|nr:hypothetical protein D9611_011338 [Tulosesus angulatus]
MNVLKKMKKYVKNGLRRMSSVSRRRDQLLEVPQPMDIDSGSNDASSVASGTTQLSQTTPPSATIDSNSSGGAGSPTMVAGSTSGSQSRLDAARIAPPSSTIGSNSPCGAGGPTVVAGSTSDPKSTLDTAWTITKETIRSLDKVADAFPPLKIATSAVVEVLKRIDGYTEFNSRMLLFKGRIDGLLAALHDIDGTPNPKLQKRLEELGKNIQDSAVRLSQMIPENDIARFLASQDHITKVERELTHVTHVIQTFGLRSMIQIEMSISAQRDESVLRKGLGACRIPGSQFGTGRPVCLEGTRGELLADLFNWATAAQDASIPVRWIEGSPGTGKTTLAETVCVWLHSKGLLAGSFFCSSSGKQEPLLGDHTRILPSLADYLADLDDDYKRALIEFLESPKRSDIREMDPARQFHALMVAPYERLGLEAKARLSKMVFVIDAPEQCHEQDMVERLLDTIAKSQECPFKFLITTRCEEHIEGALTSPKVLRMNLDNLDTTQRDIHLYLSKRLGDIPALRSCFPEWPPTEVQSLAINVGRDFRVATDICENIKKRSLEPLSRFMKHVNNPHYHAEPKGRFN